MKGFIKMSKYAGMREDLVQAGGGNSSCKISENKMLIKASGYQLSEVNEHHGYSVVDYQKITAAFSSIETVRDMTEEDSKKILEDSLLEGTRPSIETFLHAITDIYTLHTHPLVVSILACRENGMEELQNLFPEALMVPYGTPGVNLAKEYFCAFYDRKQKDEHYHADIIFLQNHGLVVSAKTAEAVIELSEMVLKKIEQYLNLDMEHYHKAYHIFEKLPEDGIIWTVSDKNVLEVFSEFQEKPWEHAVCPDCVVFLKKKFLEIQKGAETETMQKYWEQYGAPAVILYEGDIYIFAETVKKAWEIQSVLSYSGQIMRANRDVKCNILEESEQHFLLHWDAEKYRQSMK